MSSHQIASTLALRIPGMRKGSDTPASTHSFHVHDILQAHGFSAEVCIAGLLHDVIEDAGVTFDELKSFGFSDHIIHLVDLCTHDEFIQNGDARWVKMIARLVDENSTEAWAIKIADVLDNVRSSGTMSPDRTWFIKNVKARLILNVTEEIAEVEALREELRKEVM